MDRNALEIRKASIVDIAAITDIYNNEVLNGVATFDTEIKTIEDRIVWLNQHDSKHPVLVATIDTEIVAWASLSKWSDRSAYDLTAEVSIYVHQNHRGQGIGSILFEEIVQLAPSIGLHYILSRITQGNETSIRLHLKNGFQIVGVMHQVGNKFGSFLDVTIMEKIVS
ncbi:MAG: GNAT family N-acetyltransferase [Bacteroidetes bacterium B1(2017)]|nr:MAG: GNAT family N-acetyltransferase [Bacteroidetes bacterium B1(2017)]